MLGGEVPDLGTTPCPVCGERIDPADVVWDPYQAKDPRQVAMPFHRACAGDVLPPEAPGTDQEHCGICGLAFPAAVIEEAFDQLHARFRVARAPVHTPLVVWRLASREPRRFVAEHFQCLLKRVVRKEPPALPGE